LFNSMFADSGKGLGLNGIRYSCYTISKHAGKSSVSMVACIGAA